MAVQFEYTGMIEDEVLFVKPEVKLVAAVIGPINVLVDDIVLGDVRIVKMLLLDTCECSVFVDEIYVGQCGAVVGTIDVVIFEAVTGLIWKDALLVKEMV